MFGGLKIACKKNHGFTLIEVIIATAILGLLGSGIATTIFQTLTVNRQNVSSVTALKQVENVIFWVGRDTQMAQSVEMGVNAGFPLVISWLEWDGTSNQVTYSITGNAIQRSHSVNSGAPINTVLANNIDSNTALTNCQFNSDVLTFTVTSSIGGFRPAEITRTIQVMPKPLS